MIKRIALIIVLTFVGVVTCVAGTVKAHIEPKSVQPGEPFQLILELDENAPSGLPDFDPLSHDFYITGKSHSTSYLYVNGASRTTTRWAITLVPKYAGKITVPAIQIGKARSKAQVVQVTDDANQASRSLQEAPDRALFIQTLASEKNPVLNQQVIYTIKIFHQSSLLDAAYQPPQLSDALVIPLGNQKRYQAIAHGESYLVEEQQYAFFPQKEGAQVLFPPKLQALIYDNAPRRVQAGGQAITLDVKSIPEKVSVDNWLPAKRVILQEAYDSTAQQFTEGHTLTRTIILKAVGLPAELMPPLEVSENKQFNAYAEQPERSNSVENNNIVGKSIIKVNYLLNQAGTVTLPRETITWFNTQTKTVEKVTLPEKTLQIQASHATTPISANTPPVTNNIKGAPVSIKTTKTILLKHITFAAVLATFATISGIFVFFISRSRHDLKSAALKVLKAACINNNPKAAHTALIDWAKLAYPNAHILNLDDIAHTISNPALTEALDHLSRALFRPNKRNTWRGEALWRAVKAPPHKQKDKTHTTPPSTLPPMNPKI